MRVVAHEGERRTFTGPPIVVRSFVNMGVAHQGSLLPFEKSETDYSLHFTIPSNLWRPATGFDLEILSVSGFRKPDLHDPGHLYAFLHNSPPAASLAA